MKFNTKGLILTSKTLKGDQRLVTVMTGTHGVIRCFIKNRKLLSVSRSNAIQPLAYSRLSVYSGRDAYIIDEADCIFSFFETSTELEALAVAQYLCELCMYTVPDGAASQEIMSLLMNSLYVLSKHSKPELMVKSVFEMRLMALSGMTPDILACKDCGAYEDETMYFLIDKGELQCSSCYHGAPGACSLNRGALYVLRHSILAEPKRIFSFSTSDETLAQFADCAERYALSKIERTFNSLEYYKKLINRPEFIKKEQ